MLKETRRNKKNTRNHEEHEILKETQDTKRNTRHSKIHDI